MRLASLSSFTPRRLVTPPARRMIRREEEAASGCGVLLLPGARLCSTCCGLPGLETQSSRRRKPRNSKTVSFQGLRFD